jgi:hypothetical protein
MPTKTNGNRTFDARPDRVDLRDRLYQPPLVSLPDRFPDPTIIDQRLATYANRFVLDQGREGACTGFGLAAMINYLQWRRNGYRVQRLSNVSPRMLYHMARLYDEWPGEDYEGSSCRGAMKGWHRHGVCRENLWPYRNRTGRVVFVEPKKGWREDAAGRPLGAYYRIDKESIADMQSAIYEVGAIYCAAQVHAGWFLGTTANPPVIQPSNEITGGHAFAMVGFTSDGFIVQNSWGPDWGYHGFAILTYEDWVENGYDAWVAVLGAPVRTTKATRTVSETSLNATEAVHTALFMRGDRLGGNHVYQNPRVKPIREEHAYLHTVVLGNNGQALNTMVDKVNAAADVKETAYTLPRAYLTAAPRPKLAIYAHGGLNNEAASINRIRMMTPYFIENEIYPLFITWRTGILESIIGIFEDNLRSIFSADMAMTEGGFFDRLKEQIAEARDRAIEAASRHLLVKAIWAEMKQNAEAAAGTGAGLSLLARHLRRLSREIPKLEIHLVGHSAGSILLGHLLDLMHPKTRAASLSFFAPACTVAFANQHIKKASDCGVLPAAAIHMDILDDAMEQQDSVGPYGKSLLYLVSRALETVHKMPLLGMEMAWQAAPPEDQWHGGSAADLQQWQAFAAGLPTPRLYTRAESKVPTGSGFIDLAHGSFDNDTRVIEGLIKRIRGDNRLLAAIENLKGF